MQDWIIVYTGFPDGAQALAKRLDAEGLRSFVSTRPGESGRGSGAREWIAEVLVPPEAETRARERISAWEVAHARAAERLSRTIGRVALLSALPPAAWYVLRESGVVGGPAPHPWSLATLYGVSAVVLAQLAHRRAAERIEPPGY